MTTEKFDAERIGIEYDKHDRERYAQKNIATCVALNEGARFTIVFSSPVYDDALQITGEGDLYYAVVVLDGGQKLPYPLFEEVADTFFMIEEVRIANADSRHLDVPLSQFGEWMRQEFAGQFAGCIEAKSGDVTDRRDAIAAGVRKARGENGPTAKPAEGRTSKRRVSFRSNEIIFRWQKTRDGYISGTATVHGTTFAYGEGVKNVVAEIKEDDWHFDHQLAYLPTIFGIMASAAEDLRKEATSKFYRENKERLDLE